MEQKIASTMNTQRVKSKKIWLGIAHVTPMVSGLIPDGSRAHVPIFGYANNISNFEILAKRLLNAIQFEVLELDEIDNLSMNEFESKVDPEVLDIAIQLGDEAPVGYGNFYTYKISGLKGTD